MGGGPISAFMSETSLDQFFKWRAHRERELTEPTRLELYLASIRSLLFEIPFMVWGKESKVPEEKFIIKFSYDGKPTKESQEEQDEIKRKSAEQSFSIMEGVLSAVAANQKTGVDPSAGFLVQTSFGNENALGSRINADQPTPPLSPTEPATSVPAQSYATEKPVTVPDPFNPPKRKWTGGPQ